MSNFIATAGFRNSAFLEVLVFFLLAIQFADAQDRILAPPSPDVAPAIVSADSGIKSSAAGKRWSEWYRLGVGRAPHGYTLQKTEFWLTGDRTCGVLAECREVTQSDQEVLWEFRLEGDDGSRKTASSEGHIRVTYRPQ